jgi:anionic cell wall polymer biosynthesis LytR-Cps2A-Psr (LCP) family protein
LKKRKGFDKSIILLAVILVIILAAAFYMYSHFRTDTITEALENGETITIAFFVSDDNELLFTELFFYNPNTHKGAILDIPSEVGSILQSESRIDRIEVLYEPGKIGDIKRKIEDLIGTEIPYYVEMSIEDVEHAVDIIEGVEMFIANPVEDISREKIVLLPSGSMVLDGGKIRTFLLYEGDDREPEIEKIGRKQKFIQAFLNRLGEKYQELEQEAVFQYMTRYINTNLDKQSLLSFISEMRHLDVERIIFQRVLGVHRTVDDKKLLFPHYDGKLLKETVDQTIDSLASSDMVAEDNLTIHLELLNGTPRNGLASRTSQIFKSFGYEVVRVGNADHFEYEKTKVIDRSANINKAQKIANVINCRNVTAAIEEDIPQTEEGIDSPHDFEKIDVTVILGKDFDGRYCKN